ncbi:MAG: hypothetical protein WBB64_06935, partial [Anaerolineales bacterium]
MLRDQLIKNGRKLFRYVLFIVVFLIQSCRSIDVTPPILNQPAIILPSATVEQLSSLPDTPTSDIQEPTKTPVFEPPVGFIEYQDPSTGISIYIPGSWTVTGVIEGQYAIFSSYPEDKYVGGGKRESGDTKCDLNIRPQGESVDNLIQQWKSNDMTTILSEQEIILSSGQPGFRFELNNMG